MAGEEKQNEENIEQLLKCVLTLILMGDPCLR